MKRYWRTFLMGMGWTLYHGGGLWASVRTGIADVRTIKRGVLRWATRLTDV